MKEQNIQEKSFSFAVRIVNLCKLLRIERKEYVLSKQLLRSGTSIGANVAEAQQAQSRADFFIETEYCAEGNNGNKVLAATAACYGIFDRDGDSLYPVRLC